MNTFGLRPVISPAGIEYVVGASLDASIGGEQLTSDLGPVLSAEMQVGESLTADLGPALTGSLTDNTFTGELGCPK